MKPTVQDYKSLLNKVQKGNKKGDSMDDFYNDVIDAYLDNKLEKKDFEKIIKTVSK